MALEIILLVYSLYREKVALPTIINLHFTNKKNNVINIYICQLQNQKYMIRSWNHSPYYTLRQTQSQIPFISLDFLNPSIKLVSGPHWHYRCLKNRVNLMPVSIELFTDQEEAVCLWVDNPFSCVPTFLHSRSHTCELANVWELEKE